MSTLDLARFQFASTSIYHFLFVPLTIGLALLVAILHTAWYRSDKPEYRRLARFFGSLLLINVAVGVVSGLVQEFQFGMNWSGYSRFVGDVFGAPLAMEGLAAFFLESTFLGLWVFGWKVLPRGLHLATVWAVAVGAMLSAAFIMAANSWMQHPVGYEINPDTGRAQLTDIGAVFSNPVFIWGYVHVVIASVVTGAMVMLAVSAWYLRKRRLPRMFHRTAVLSIVVLLPASILALGVGSHLGVVETTYQPMKIAAAEAQWESCQPCSFSAFQIGGGNDDQNPTKVIQIPHLLSILATGSWDGGVTGMNELNAQYQQEYGPGDYVPNVFVQYWSMRVMAYGGTAVVLLGLWAGLLAWRRRLPRSRLFLRIATWAAVVPFVLNTAGWMLTENGRQPWLVQGLMQTSDGVSASVSTTDLVLSLIAFYGIYLVLGAVAVTLMLRTVRHGPPEESDQDDPDQTPGPRVAALTY